MCNYELRKSILDNGIYKRYTKARRNSYLTNKGEEVEGETLEGFEVFLTETFGADWFSIVEECERIGNSSYQRIKRLKTRIKTLLNEGQCLFLTLTFNDLTIFTTTERERKDLVMKFLKQTENNGFIANIDYGATNEREHYHAVLCAEKVDYTKWHNYGAIKGQKVALRKKTETKLARYIDKLALHSLKDSTNKNRLLYGKIKFDV